MPILQDKANCLEVSGLLGNDRPMHRLLKRSSPFPAVSPPTTMVWLVFSTGMDVPSWSGDTSRTWWKCMSNKERLGRLSSHWYRDPGRLVNVTGTGIPTGFTRV